MGTVGVYKITNLINNDCYVGSSKNIEERWKQHLHKYDKENRREYNYHIYRAFRKYGISNFKFEILEVCSEEERLIREKWYFEKLNPRYNELVPKDNTIWDKKLKKIHKERCKRAWAERTEENKAKVYANLEKGRNNPLFLKNKKDKKPIIAIRLSDGFEQQFKSMYEAQKALDIARSSISQILNPNHKKNKEKGYTFKFA